MSFARSNQPQIGQKPHDLGLDPPPGRLMPSQRPGAPAAVVVADLAVVAFYVIVGRLSHDESAAPAGLLTTGWPFLVGLAGGYLGVALTRWPLTSVRSGAVVSAKTVIIGLVLRYGVAGEGTPFSYVVVTAVVIVGLMLAWRLVARRALRSA